MGKLAIFTFNEKLKIKQVCNKKNYTARINKETEFITCETSVSQGGVGVVGVEREKKLITGIFNSTCKAENISPLSFTKAVYISISRFKCSIRTETIKWQEYTPAINSIPNLVCDTNKINSTRETDMIES